MFSDVFVTPTSELYEAVNALQLTLDIDNADDETIVLLCRQFRIYPHIASSAVLRASFTFPQTNAPQQPAAWVGTTVIINGKNLQIGEVDIQNSLLTLTTLETGSTANTIPLGTSFSVGDAGEGTITEYLVIGRDTESIQTFRTRYKTALKVRSQMGTMTWFIETALSVAWVSCVRIVRPQNPYAYPKAATVYVANSSYQSLDISVLRAVQTKLEKA